MMYVCILVMSCIAENTILIFKIGMKYIRQRPPWRQESLASRSCNSWESVCRVSFDLLYLTWIYKLKSAWVTLK